MKLNPLIVSNVFSFLAEKRIETEELLNDINQGIEELK